MGVGGGWRKRSIPLGTPRFPNLLPQSPSCSVLLAGGIYFPVADDIGNDHIIRGGVFSLYSRLGHPTGRPLTSASQARAFEAPQRPSICHFGLLFLRLLGHEDCAQDFPCWRGKSCPLGTCSAQEGLAGSVCARMGAGGTHRDQHQSIGCAGPPGCRGTWVQAACTGERPQRDRETEV